MKIRMTKKGKQNIRHLIILLAIYAVAVIIFCMLSANRGTTDLTEELAEPSFPVVHFLCNGNEVNETYGYSKEMNAGYIRNTITPVDEERRISFVVDTYGEKINGLYYELRSMDGERLLENNEITDYEYAGDSATVTLTLQNLMDDDTEYVLTLCLDTPTDNLYYYTRVMKETSGTAGEILDFVQKFHHATFSKAESLLISDHIETSNALAKSTLSYVDIHSSEAKIRWSDMDPEIVSEEQYSIAEISTYYYAVKVNYIVNMVDNGAAHNYDVEEYYRLRVGEDDIYLYDFERTTNQIFSATEENYMENYVQVGITEGDVSFLANASGTMLAFVKEGDLWLYDINSDEIVKIFSFRGSDFTDSRKNNLDHDISVLSMDESGTTQFVVSGYMSRGAHEGEVGVGIYRYNRTDNTIEEELWISSDKSASVIELDTAGIFYASAANVFYMMINGNLYGINILDHSVVKLQEGLDPDNFLVSESGERIAWVSEEDADHSKTIQVMDLETETVSIISGGTGEYLRPLAFLQEDFVYGVAKATEIGTDAAGNTNFLMSKVVILDENLTEIKNYALTNCFVTSAYLEDDVLHLVRVQKTEEGYEEIAEDTIINYNLSETIFNQQLDISTDDDVGSGRLAITMANSISNPNPRLVTTENIVTENADTIKILRQEEDADRYFVYRGCEAILSTKQLSKAITLASETGGAVIGDGQSYIWRRGRGSYITLAKLTYPDTAAESSTVAQCIDAILDLEDISNNAEHYLDRGDDVYETMQETLSDYHVLNLTGCIMDDVLYYVARSTPVLAMVDESNAVLIVGYDSYNITLFYPETQTFGKKSIDDAEELFAAAGNVFVGYLR